MSGLTYWPQPASAARPARPVRVAASAAAAPRKALYLDGREQAIDLRLAGPALSITRAARRTEVPLARVARVVVCGRVHWDSAALAACLQHGLPVIFLDGRARPLGAAAPLADHGSSLDELLACWVERRRWREGWDNWLRAQRYRVLRHWVRERAQRGLPVAAGEWKEAVRSFVYVPEAEFTGPNPGGCYALVVSLLLRAGVRLQYRAADGGALPLAAELARLVDRRGALGLGSLAPAVAVGDAALTRAAETNSPDLEQYAIELLARLRRNLADRIEPCP